MTEPFSFLLEQKLKYLLYTGPPAKKVSLNESTEIHFSPRLVYLVAHVPAYMKEC